MIADLRRERWTLRDIADGLGRSASTISRELRHNADRGRYLPATADKTAVGRIARPRARRVATDAELRAVVVELLDKRWSSAQVAHELPERVLHAFPPRIFIVLDVADTSPERAEAGDVTRHPPSSDGPG